MSWSIPTLLGILHLAGIAVWVSCMLYPLIGLGNQPVIYLQSLKRIQPWMMGAMVLSVTTGLLKIMTMGGFKALPTPFHIKITIGLILLGLSLTQMFYLLPKAEAMQASGMHSPTQLKGLTVCSSLFVLGTLVILMILGGLGIL